MQRRGREAQLKKGGRRNKPNGGRTRNEYKTNANSEEIERLNKTDENEIREKTQLRKKQNEGSAGRILWLL